MSDKTILSSFTDQWDYYGLYKGFGHEVTIPELYKLKTWEDKGACVIERSYLSIDNPFGKKLTNIYPIEVLYTTRYGEWRILYTEQIRKMIYTHLQCSTDLFVPANEILHLSRTYVAGIFSQKDYFDYMADHHSEKPWMEKISPHIDTAIPTIKLMMDMAEIIAEGETHYTEFVPDDYSDAVNKSIAVPPITDRFGEQLAKGCLTNHHDLFKYVKRHGKSDKINSIVRDTQFFDPKNPGKLQPELKILDINMVDTDIYQLAQYIHKLSFREFHMVLFNGIIDVKIASLKYSGNKVDLKLGSYHHSKDLIRDDIYQLIQECLLAKSVSTLFDDYGPHKLTIYKNGYDEQYYEYQLIDINNRAIGDPQRYMVDGTALQLVSRSNCPVEDVPSELTH
ncbi:MAG: hypothetical protein GY804_09210 [Alphaproteobacteria bacterium]|nr:hypothetical protein [Alphaproteobacteria bacterium]